MAASCLHPRSGRQLGTHRQPTLGAGVGSSSWGKLQWEEAVEGGVRRGAAVHAGGVNAGGLPPFMG